MGGSSLWTDPRVADLFSESPDRFVARRNALAAELAAAGDPAAQQVRALRRPTRRLWILNRLARERPEGITRLLETGAELKRAHVAALEGAGARLRQADEEMSRRLDELVRRASALLGRDGERPDPTLLAALRTDLRAVATGSGPDAERLRAGTLDHVPAGEPAGAFGEVAAAFTGGWRTPPSPGKRTPGAAARARDAARLARARVDLRRARQALAAAERALQRREREAAGAEAEAARRRARADEARRAVEAARARVARAREAVRA